MQERLVEIAEPRRRLHRERDAARSTSRTSPSPRRSSPTTTRSTSSPSSLDELAINILARQQPVARDLRIVVSALRISASLERMGDMAEHIAQLARYRFPDKVVPKSLRAHVRRDGRSSTSRSPASSPSCCSTEDVALAEEIRNDDDKIDALHLSVFDKVLGETWKGEAVDTVDATLASRYHERFADHAVSIAKKVQYLATGDWVPSDS